MRFWDGSAIVTLVTRQPQTARALDLLRVDSDVVVWWATPVECWSALSRLERARQLSPTDVNTALRELGEFSSAWYEIAAVEEVRLQARRILRTHALRAADALQLGAALVWSGSGEGREMVTFDERLRDAARIEGFVA